jgi:hypothetical protein
MREAGMENADNNLGNAFESKRLHAKAYFSNQSQKLRAGDIFLPCPCLYFYEGLRYYKMFDITGI